MPLSLQTDPNPINSLCDFYPIAGLVMSFTCDSSSLISPMPNTFNVIKGLVLCSVNENIKFEDLFISLLFTKQNYTCDKTSQVIAIPHPASNNVNYNPSCFYRPLCFALSLFLCRAEGFYLFVLAGGRGEYDLRRPSQRRHEGRELHLSGRYRLKGVGLFRPRGKRKKCLSTGTHLPELLIRPSDVPGRATRWGCT